MLVQPRKDINTLALNDPEITGGVLLPDGVWGVNLAAARLNFPDKGLKCQIPPWNNMDEGDKVELLLHGAVMDQKTITTPAKSRTCHPVRTAESVADRGLDTVLRKAPRIHDPRKARHSPSSSNSNCPAARTPILTMVTPNWPSHSCQRSCVTGSTRTTSRTACW